MQDAGVADALYNATSYVSDALKADVQAGSQASLLSTIMANKLAVAFALVVIAVVGKMMTGGQKLPKGAKPLPELPGMSTPFCVPAKLC